MVLWIGRVEPYKRADVMLEAMPAILIDPKEQAEWLNGGEESLRLQRLLSNEDLKIREQGSE